MLPVSPQPGDTENRGIGRAGVHRSVIAWMGQGPPKGAPGRLFFMARCVDCTPESSGGFSSKVDTP